MRYFRSMNSEAAQRSAERRQREKDAPRLLAEVPNLKSLRLQLEERRDGRTLPESAHVRHFPMAEAPALFDLPCLDPSCRDGGHDATRQMLNGLRRGQTRFEGEDNCYGTVGSVGCQRVLALCRHCYVHDLMSLSERESRAAQGLPRSAW